MSAALTRLANPDAEVGHAGPTAPIHDDPRLEVARAFAADLPLLADEGPRARFLQRDADQLERTRKTLRDVLVALEALIEAHAALRGNDDRDVRAARRALTLARLP